MPLQFDLGKVFGITITLHFTWLFTAFLIVDSLWNEYQRQQPNWSLAVLLLITISTATLFFASLIAHELAHALVARHRGVMVRQIVLFALGGVSLLESDPTRARDEFWIAIVGPLTSFALVILCAFTAAGTSALDTPAASMFAWLAFINAGLGLFNLLPAFPMDGGRVLRSIIWAATGKAQRSTHIVVVVSQCIAAVVILGGILLAAHGDVFGGVWIGLLGWYMMSTARSSYRPVSQTPYVSET